MYERNLLPGEMLAGEGCNCPSDSSVITKWILIGAGLWFVWNKTKLPEKAKLR